MPISKLHMGFFNTFVCLFFLCFCIFVFVFCMWFFFSTNDYYYLINLGDCMLFGCLSLFCFNWPSFFNKGIWVNLYKLTFFIPPLFHSEQKKKWKKLKFFLSSDFSILLSFSILSLFYSFNQTGPNSYNFYTYISCLGFS